MSQLQYFLGANSPTGFYSLYHELMPTDRAEAVYILKGGAGCGKSSFMRRVARHAEASGLDTVLIPCSGDPDSLDGVILPQRNIALVDGTAPHVVEPKLPGVVESYVNLGDCYDRKALAPLRREIADATSRYQGHYKRVYRCLDAASQLQRDNRELLLTEGVQERLVKRAEGIISREIRKNGGENGEVTHRFLSAVTHRGKVYLWDTVSAQAKRVYELADNYGLAHELLSPILTAAAAAGWDVTACPDPMAPERLAHLIIPGLGLAFVSTTEEEPLPLHSHRRLRLDTMADRELYRTSRPRLRFTKKVASALEAEAISGLSQAKEAHDQLESLYNPHVDFERVYAMADDLADTLFTTPEK
jgi:hypothetical protein